MNKKNSKLLKILACVLIFVGIVVIIFGLYIGLTNNEEKVEIKNDTPEQILDKLSIGNYFKYTLNADTENNKNLLDVLSDDNMMNYAYSSDKIKHYKIPFPSGTSDGDITFVYVKYSEYIDFHNKYFGVTSTIEIEDRDLYIEKLDHINDENYEAAAPVNRCDNDNPSDCYIFLNRDLENENIVNFSNLTMENGIINGNVKLQSEDGNILDAEFTLNFENKNYNYIIKSLIINSILDDSNI